MGNKKISPPLQEEDRVRSIARLVAAAERELSAFVAAVSELFGAEQAPQAAETWMEELAWADWDSGNPAADWRRITIAAARRVKGQVPGS